MSLTYRIKSRSNLFVLICSRLHIWLDRSSRRSRSC